MVRFKQLIRVVLVIDAKLKKKNTRYKNLCFVRRNVLLLTILTYKIQFDFFLNPQQVIVIFRSFLVFTLWH
jgi:hypothetical protein